MSIAATWLCVFAGPPERLPMHFPLENHARRGSCLADAWHNWLDKGDGLHGVRPEVAKCALSDALMRRRLWEDVLALRLMESWGQQDTAEYRARAADLRERLGWPTFYLGPLPSPVPLVR